DPAMQTERTPRFQAASQRADRKWRRALWNGYAGAILVHLAALLLPRTVSVPPTPFAAAGPRMGGVRAAAGGGQGMEMVEVRAQRESPPEEEPEPVPVPVPVPEPVVVPPREE